MLRYAATIFLSAFLLFQVQPLIGKYILPWFGGTPTVWTTCMLFFQITLLLGYSYAHLIASKLPPKFQAFLHLTLLAGSLLLLPIARDAAGWKTTGEEVPIARILALLASTIGLPYFLLSTTGPLLQEMFRRETGRVPYRLYSLSNVGSLLALLTYPFLFEPQLTLKTQILSWSWSYVAFVVLCSWCMLVYGLKYVPETAAAASDAETAAPAPRPTSRAILLWLALSACGSVMLLATTNQLCQEITSVPFLWVVPLAVYLLTFIICFDHERWYHRSTFLVLLTLGVLSVCYAMYKGHQLNITEQLAIYSLALWACCMVCHGELVKAKPVPQYLTLFYLMVAAGGALGGVFVAIVAPLVLPDVWEYHIGLLTTVLLAFAVTFSDSETSPTKVGSSRVWWLASGAVAIMIGLLLAYAVGQRNSQASDKTNLETTRNFYGVLRVNDYAGLLSTNGPERELVHGQIQHGFQYLDEDKRNWPTTYYGHTSGVGVAIEHHPRRQAADPADQTLRIGVVGLGCGTLASYGREGDVIRFYEINPEVIRISDQYFTFRRDSKAKVEIVLGDARITMENEIAAGESQQFDVLAIDAFSSDAIPMHLLTKESVELFLKELNPDGLLCIHISNRFLDLEGVVRGIAESLGYECHQVNADIDKTVGVDYSTWVILTKNREFLDNPALATTLKPCTEPPVVWTDDYGSLWQVLDTPWRKGAETTEDTTEESDE